MIVALPFWAGIVLSQSSRKEHSLPAYRKAGRPLAWSGGRTAEWKHNQQIEVLVRLNAQLGKTANHYTNTLLDSIRSTSFLTMHANI